MNWKKFWIIAGIVIALLAVVGFTVKHNQAGIVAVQLGKVKTEDLASVVTASGEIKPKVYVNIGANAFGKITHLYVKEGQRVKAGQLLAQLESVQPAASVAQMRASMDASKMDEQAAVANVKTSDADVNSMEADLEQKKLDYHRAQGLFKDQLIAKQDYDAKKAAYDASVANLAQAQARLAQAKAQVDSASGHIAAAQANLVSASDALSKTIYKAPYDGTITNLPVREGETVVVGIQNSPGSTLMTLADLSVITAEVHVDETDIVNVTLGQPAEVSIDAIPDKTFKATVTEIGDNAIVRSTGISTSESTGSTEEAKDFKVVVTLTDPPPNMRPGLSATAKITTATRHDAIAIPIQALTVREPKDLEDNAGKKAGTVAAAEPSDTGDAAGSGASKDIQGVFVVDKTNHAKFVPVTTGISGTTDIEVLSGLKSGDQIVTGSYKVLRSLRNNARIKEEKIDVKMDEQAS